LITPQKIAKILSGYDLDRLTIGTLGSHSALNILKGAKEEGFKTISICKKQDAIIYKKFPLADEIIFVKNFTELLDEKLQQRLRDLNVVLIPHGSFTAYLSTEQLMNDLNVPMFGNRMLLHWEASRTKQEEWLRSAGLKLPKTYKRPSEIKGLAIAKLPGAKGGRGYFLVSSAQAFDRKVNDMVKRRLLSKEDVKQIHLQEYVLGLNVYPHYFGSILEDDVEFLGVDRRYESAVDAIGRIPATEQLEADINPTYTIVGNIPITLRESLLPELMRMGDNVMQKAAELAPPGIIGPFCLETVITDTLEIYTFEVSARIVAGTNVAIGTGPYAYLKFGQNMYAGRRIALEIKNGLRKSRIKEIVA
jgi:5-formaminoimidazole-4-carboxamide-1-(beta)-D-ribofuranosyl 5'-monophosphate synthetase